MNASTEAQALGALLLSLYEASQESKSVVEFQNIALELIQPILRFNSSLWACGAITAMGFEPSAQHLYNQSAEVLTAHREVKQQDAAMRVLAEQGGGTISFNARDFFRSAEFSAIRDYTRRFEHENTLVMSVVDPESRFVNWISLYRADPAEHFHSADKGSAEVISAHLFKALSISKRAQLARLTRHRADTDQRFAICDSAGFLHYAEEGFVEILEQEEPCRAGPRKVSTSVLSTLARAGTFQGRSITIRAREDAGLLFLILRPRRPADGLSVREQQVVGQIAEGRTYKEIASTLHLSPATVRTHIQRIHRKLSTSNTAELLAAVDFAGDRERVKGLS